MINLTSKNNGISLNISIQGYQFPDDPNDNWCNVKVAVKQGDNVFEAVDPCLDTSELLAILNWFQSLAQRRLPKYATFTFTEPCLEFKFLACNNDTVRISIGLRHELEPDFALKQFGMMNEKCDLVFELSGQDFLAAIAGVKAAVCDYPQRPER